MSEPTTPTGEALARVLRRWPNDMVAVSDILAIEREARDDGIAIGRQQERERLRARYEDARSDAAGPYVFEPSDVVAVSVMDAVVRSLLADPEDEA